ncbi:phosphoserine phosphatase SerB [Desulfovibrio aminophilus]|uniref:phosphoserine phosphatase SerB n=1 Tax=Desulfovibrio aminophilus TaxID=81425 RepID=UPI0003F66F8F|nr:phosphoserine phosphatase SerB [Desulfovibrio aminophilus]
MSEIILIHVTGEDRPGITASLTGVLAEYGVEILDVGQIVIHNFMTLGILIHIPAQAESAPILKDVLFKAHELGVELKLHPLSPRRYEAWVRTQGKARHIVTLIARRVNAAQIERISKALADDGLNIDRITRLSGRIPLSGGKAPRMSCVEFSVRGTPHDPVGLRRKFVDAAQELGVDIALQEDNVFRRNRRLVAFDMDSTLVRAEVIDELAKRAGVGHKVAAITERAMRGELDFKESLRARLALLKGLPESVLAEVAETLPLTEGAQRLVATLKRVGYKTAILSGGFTYFGEKLAEKLGIDHVFANELEIKDGALTGKVVGSIVDGAKKAQLLKRIAKKEKISLQQVIAVGDGANDLPMLGLAGLGIAFHAKPKVKQGARQSISTLGLDSILFLIGFREREAVREEA